MRVPEFDIRSDDWFDRADLKWCKTDNLDVSGNFNSCRWASYCERGDYRLSGTVFKWSIYMPIWYDSGVVTSDRTGVYVQSVKHEIPSDVLKKVLEKAHEVHEALKKKKIGVEE